MSCNISFLKINFEADFVEIGIFLLKSKVEKWKRKSETMRGESSHFSHFTHILFCRKWTVENKKSMISCKIHDINSEYNCGPSPPSRRAGRRRARRGRRCPRRGWSGSPENYHNENQKFDQLLSSGSPEYDLSEDQNFDQALLSGLPKYDHNEASVISHQSTHCVEKSFPAKLQREDNVRIWLLKRQCQDMAPEKTMSGYGSWKEVYKYQWRVLG